MCLYKSWVICVMQAAMRKQSVWKSLTRASLRLINIDYSHRATSLLPAAVWRFCFSQSRKHDGRLAACLSRSRRRDSCAFSERVLAAPPADFAHIAAENPHLGVRCRLLGRVNGGAATECWRITLCVLLFTHRPQRSSNPFAWVLAMLINIKY